MGVSEELSALVIGLRDMIDLVLIISILLLVIIILKIIEKSYKVRLELRKRDRNLFYQRELKKLRELKSSPEKVLDKVNIIARGFFKEAFNMSYHLEYLELVEEFRKIGKGDCISFCKLISELNYSGEEISLEKINRLLSLLERIMRDNKILSEEEKLILKKRGPLDNLADKVMARVSKEPAETAGSNPPAKTAGPTTPAPVKRKDINYINWRYKLRIILLRIRGRIPEIKKVRLERQEAVSGVNKDVLDNKNDEGSEYKVS